MRRIISILLQNEAGALARVAGMFSARGYNIDSLTVATTRSFGAAPDAGRFQRRSGDRQIVNRSRKLIDASRSPV
jgi:acetolactate synthase-1/3 small subunit